MALINYLTRVEFGEGSLSKSPSMLEGLTFARLLIVTDRGLAATGLLDRLVSLFSARPTIFEDTPASPTEDAAHAAFHLYQKGGCDGVVGFVGGSSLGFAKAVRLLSGHEGPPAHYIRPPPRAAPRGSTTGSVRRSRCRPLREPALRSDAPQ